MATELRETQIQVENLRGDTAVVAPELRETQIQVENLRGDTAITVTEVRETQAFMENDQGITARIDVQARITQAWMEISRSMSPGLPTTMHLQLTGKAGLTTSGSFVTPIQGRLRNQLRGQGTLTLSGTPPPVPSTFDCMATVISQYANSPILLKLIENFCSYIDPAQDLENFYNYIWNVDTAKGYGLDVWGRIVGVTRTLTLSNPGPYFGFEEATDALPFGQGPFWGGAGSSSNFNLSDVAYRQLIFAKALANISDGTIPAINQLMINLFGPGNVYVRDLGGMAIQYKFEFTPTQVQLAIAQQSGVLPKPVGVSATVSVPP